MVLTKKETKITFEHIKDNKGKAFGSLNIEKLKGGVLYKVYHEMITAENFLMK